MSLAYLFDRDRFKLAVGRSIVKADEFKVLLDARELLDECASLSERLREEGRQAHELARQRGLEQGIREGLAQCAQQLAATEIEAARYLGALDQRIVAMVVEVVRRIAPRIGAQQIVPELAAQAIKEVRAERFLVVKVHPDNREQVERRIGEVKQSYPMIEFIQVLADPHLGPFDCVLESEAGLVRADLETQLDAIEAAMRISGQHDRTAVAA